ncbi:hypothetical protein DV702_15375 [Sporosarcina sp. PTS2304]|uniref:hypothetical protein n=1 Tax=Sporosarcina sp. PTS2304 TaxID=2283194 RepID=UPI000E0D9A67|nr:hypothetical protein [Sporosarcina sp. PTS2304]AXI00969.1 hypothetical protein DV702_15375 [Sporosarcina sp. PTS2304]
MNFLLLFLFWIGWCFMPIWCTVFCMNLVSIMKKVKHEEKTTANTVWLIISLTMIMWTTASQAMGFE